MSEQSIYVSYASADAATIDRLARELTGAGYTVAINRHTVPPGEALEPALRAAVSAAARFVVCFSSRDSGPASYDPMELLLALEQRAERAGEPWLIPVKLTRCELPPFTFGGGTLRDAAAIDLFSDWNLGIQKLVAALPRREDPANTAGTSPDSGRFDVVVEKVRAGSVVFTGFEGEGETGGGRTSFRADELTADGTFSLTHRRFTR